MAGLMTIRSCLLTTNKVLVGSKISHTELLKSYLLNDGDRLQFVEDHRLSKHNL